MKQVTMIASAAVFSVAAASAAAALDATDTWRGSILVTAVTSACDKPGFPVLDQTLLSVFRPQFVNTDPPPAFLITFNNGALLVNPTGSTPTKTGPYRGDVLNGIATYGSYTGGSYTLVTQPALNNFSPDMPQIIISSGKLTKFRGTVGCTVSFKGAFFKGVI